MASTSRTNHTKQIYKEKDAENDLPSPCNRTNKLKLKNLNKLLYLCISMFIATVRLASAQNITLTWDQNIEPKVAGYNIYYRRDFADFPFNGSNLSEGVSPIFVDGSATTSLSLDLPEDDRIYYFTATAVNGTQAESSFSDIIASDWIPYLFAPVDNEAIDTGATFEWELPLKLQRVL